MVKQSPQHNKTTSLKLAYIAITTENDLYFEKAIFFNLTKNVVSMHKLWRADYTVIYMTLYYSHYTDLFFHNILAV